MEGAAPWITEHYAAAAAAAAAADEHVPAAAAAAAWLAHAAAAAAAPVSAAAPVLAVVADPLQCTSVRGELQAPGQLRRCPNNPLHVLTP